MVKKSIFLFVFVFFVWPIIAADTPAADPPEFVFALRDDISRNSVAAVEQFWNEMRQNGAPLIESIPGDNKHSLVTFVWRASAQAHNVVITDGVAVGVGGVDPVNSEMARIPETDVWYRAYEARNDARFSYSLSENDPLVLILPELVLVRGFGELRFIEGKVRRRQRSIGNKRCSLTDRILDVEFEIAFDFVGQFPLVTRSEKTGYGNA